MAFVFRTRLVQYADVDGQGVQIELTNPSVLFTSQVGTVVPEMADAMGLVPPGQRPAVEDWWKYRLEWRVQWSAVPTILGVVAQTGRLVFDVAMWDTASARQAAPANPQRQVTFLHEFTSRTLAGSAAQIGKSIDDFLLRATFGNYPADYRGPIANATRATDSTNDPLGLLSRQAILDRDGVAEDRPARWRTTEG